MKTSQVSQLKEVIRALIHKELKPMIQEEVSKAMGKVLVEMVKEIKKPLPNSKNNQPVINEDVEQVEELEQRSPIATLKTNNPLLNEALATTSRTYRGMPRNPGAGSLVSMMDGGFDKVGQSESVDYEEPTTNLGRIKNLVAESSVPQVESVLDVKNELPPHLQKLFSGKNLGAILKKSKEPGAGSGASVGMSS